MERRSETSWLAFSTRGQREKTSSLDILGLMDLRASVRPFRDWMTFFMERSILAEADSVATGAAITLLTRQRRETVLKRILNLGGGLARERGICW